MLTWTLLRDASHEIVKYRFRWVSGIRSIYVESKCILKVVRLLHSINIPINISVTINKTAGLFAGLSKSNRKSFATIKGANSLHEQFGQHLFLCKPL